MEDGQLEARTDDDDAFCIKVLLFAYYEEDFLWPVNNIGVVANNLS